MGHMMSPSGHVMGAVVGQMTGQILPAGMQVEGIGHPMVSIPMGHMMSPSAQVIGGKVGHSCASTRLADNASKIRHDIMMVLVFLSLIILDKIMMNLWPE